FAVKNILLNHFSSLRVAQHIYTRHGNFTRAMGICGFHALLATNKKATVYSMPADNLSQDIFQDRPTWMTHSINLFLREKHCQASRKERFKKT
ncbi:hypothetical protein, partial [Endozoicomonas sp. ONNA2]|uniref:hypothetical protein n=1 Tax=Endozoicomonas sp. ONNA2 TaxID=2828741 RepID=UPI00214876DE